MLIIGLVQILKVIFIHYCLIVFFFPVGYTMADIRYKWNDGINSVQISNDVSLPQFKVLGHRQKTIEASLSTGKPFISFILIQVQLLKKGSWTWFQYSKGPFCSKRYCHCHIDCLEVYLVQNEWYSFFVLFGHC